MEIRLSPEIAVYTGRARGREDRVRFKINDIDRSDTNGVAVVIPLDVYTMTSSYFLELFGDSIRYLGREGFERKYNIKAPDHVSRKFEDWIARALREKKGLFGGEI